jgi:hypothetical protein
LIVLAKPISNRDVQEVELLELLRAGKQARVEWSRAVVADQLRDLPLGAVVV